MKEVALVTDGIYPYVIGGMQKHAFYLAKYMAGAGMRVHLYHTGDGAEEGLADNTFFSEEEKANITANYIPFPKKGNLPGHYVRASYAYADAVFEALKPKLSQVEFILCKGFTALRLLDEKEKGLACPPIAVQLHGLEMFQRTFSLKSKLQIQLLKHPARQCITKADYVFSYGNKIAKLHEELGVKPDRIFIQHGGVEERYVRETANSKKHKQIRFLYVGGRDERRKGLEELNGVITDIVGSEEFEFHFIGPVPEDKQIDSPKLKYWGVVRDINTYNKIVDEADVLVLPSISEGFPTVIIEAMSRGLAVIATDVGAVAESVGPKNGWLIEAADVIQLRRAIREAIDESDDRLLAKKQASLQLIRDRFTWERHIQEIQEFLKQLEN